MNNKFKSGFVGLIGRPNVGKSTLLNTFIGQKITITSEKPQTTRNSLRGILTTDEYQVVWIDTPGLHQPLHRLGDQMNRAAQSVIPDVDLILWVLDGSAGFTSADKKVAAILKGSTTPIFILWNKDDLVAEGSELPKLDLGDKQFRVSAQTGRGIPELLAEIVKELPIGPAFYPPDQLTDHPEKFVVAEFLREKALQFTQDEVPHAVAVQVEEMKERSNGLIYIEATLYVERDSQKGIIIGAGGERLKSIGKAAREDLERLLDAPVYLNLWVKVRKNWRNNEASLKEFGYWKEETRDS
ncbi:MAG TPA: GTPase Era [Firmicutes bacterium]|jgi:GTPase|nr:GTPase Era [Bacillota bacterium]